MNDVHLLPADARLTAAVSHEEWFDDEQKNAEMGFGLGESGIEAAYEAFLGLIESGRALGVFRGDQPIGYATIEIHGRPYKLSEFYLFLAPGHRNTRASLKALLEIQRQTLGNGSHRLETEVLQCNRPAGRILERAGFKPEGIRSCRYWMDGEPHNTVPYRLLKKEWRAA